MSTTASLQVSISGPDDDLRLVYNRDDNLLPSELAEKEQTEANVAAGCNAVPAPTRTPAEQRAYEEQLHHLDQHAWPTRKLRLYPPVNALLRCSYGRVTPLHVVEEEVDEVITFSGSDQATMSSRGNPYLLEPIGRVFDEAGNQVVSPALQYRGEGLISTDRRIWGLVRARYRTSYRVIELVCTPTGEDFQVQVIAYDGDDVASAIVDYELLEFDTGQVAGVDCGGGGIDAGEEPQDPPPPVARYELINLEHAAEVEKGKALNVNMILRNINGVSGSGAVQFRLRFGDAEVSAAFSCDANATAQVNLSVTPTKTGFFVTEGQVIGDFFSTQNRQVKVYDPEEELPEEWNEVEREMSDIDVDGVLIKRIENVTFDRGETGRKVKLIFDNSGVE